MQKFVNKLIDNAVRKVDRYVNNGSTWLIFTQDKKWVIELTKEGTLWYNYNFFKNVFSFLGLDVVENQHYITKWVEDNVIRDGVKVTNKSLRVDDSCVIEDTVQNGVKYTIDTTHHKNKLVEDAIQNGVKETELHEGVRPLAVNNTIHNGVKQTYSGGDVCRNDSIEDTIDKGVKETHSGCDLLINDSIERVIQNGVKYTGGIGNPMWMGGRVEDTIENGVKRTSGNKIPGLCEIEDTIQNGVKKTYSDKIPHEYDWSNQFTEEIDDIIQNGVKHTEKSLQIDGSCVIEDVIKEGVIEHGIKETKSEVATREWKAGEVINGGIKETTPGGYLGSVERKGKMVHQFEHSKQDDNVEDVIKSGIKATTTNLPLSQDDGQIAEIEDVIKNGIKKTEAAALFDEESKIDTVISNGIKETHDDAYHHTGRVKGVIKNGVKECIPSRHPLYNPMDFSVQYRENHRLDDVASVLEKGIKEVQPLPSQEGNKDWGDYYYRQEDRTKPHTQYVNDVITNGIKETWGYEKQPQKRIDEVIMNGQKD